MSTEIKENDTTTLTQFCGPTSIGGERRSIQISKKGTGRVASGWTSDYIQLDKLEAKELIKDLANWLESLN
tara:strand:- start:80 stop:292 length:213 start_codon:yes stop_codon:yes gene_type:complete